MGGWANTHDARSRVATSSRTAVSAGDSPRRAATSGNVMPSVHDRSSTGPPAAPAAGPVGTAAIVTRGHRSARCGKCSRCRRSSTAGSASAATVASTSAMGSHVGSDTMDRIEQPRRYGYESNVTSRPAACASSTYPSSSAAGPW
ncbi:Uncharacterised protein [Mycobacteroides abscessus]|nr:Uncharacterised protein [Mycobacteroides abscessus]